MVLLYITLILIAIFDNGNTKCATFECKSTGSLKECGHERIPAQDCQEGHSFGFKNSTIWVHLKCAGKFKVCFDSASRFSCDNQRLESIKKKKWKKIDLNNNLVVMTVWKKRSPTKPCIAHKTYGRSGKRAWVDRGCKALFRFCVRSLTNKIWSYFTLNMSSSYSGICRNCRVNIHGGQRFCENCGFKIEANTSTVVCLGKLENGNQCNGLLRNNASFCQNCGTPSHILAQAQAPALNMIVADSKSLSTISTDDEDGDILKMSDAVLEDEAQDSVSNMGGASLNTISTDDEDGDIWKMSDVVLEDEALDNQTLYADLYNQLGSEGPSRTEASIEERLNRWETEEIQFGIIGRSAMGKSTFINLMLNLSPGDSGYAAVGQGDCTKSIKIYEHPMFSKFKLVDFPGFGTINMTKEQFLVKFNSVNLDYFFVFFDTVFMEEDAWIVTELKKRGIAYSFVRSKIDRVVDEARKMGTNEQQAIGTKRRELEDTMARNIILRGTKLFLISSFREYFYCGDLIRLLQHITSIIPQGKMEALLFFLPLLTPELILLKCNTLRKRIKFVAFAAGAVSAIPIPLIDLPVNIAIVTREVRRYIRILHLDHKYVKKVPGIKHPSLKENNALESIRAQFIKCLKLGAVAAVSQLDWVLPGIGSAIAGPSAIVFVAHHLNSELKVLRADAGVVYDYLSNQKSQT
ncbi:unnamed protein product [Mytilus coruscus]|uniref:IRG-type G domain-containing protein n=1 Tax=Mytilus coruscus TaxID=42192 RepID=A0A6J8APU2_MYTCO|nr:unnamed protein product [Mytilus coruscus]CAC5370076.1 unnamed protein product [Mytilus coruscus]